MCVSKFICCKQSILLCSLLGYVGIGCESICSHYNPCKNSATCLQLISSPHGYKCLCGVGFTGKYCEELIESKCPAGWYGHPACGPCNCATDKGLDANCDSFGHCKCKVCLKHLILIFTFHFKKTSIRL